MLSTQLNHLIDEAILQRMCIVRIPNYTINMVGDRRVVVLLAVEVIDSTCTEKIGNPAACDAPAAGAARPAVAKPEPTTEETKPIVTPAKPMVTKSNTKPTINPSNRAGGPSVIPIMGLSPYSNKWRIKARVVQKSEIKHWHNGRGEGKLFSVTLSDESGQIKATGFNDTVDQLYERLVVGDVFFVSRAKVSMARKPYNTLPHDYEIMFENQTEVDECVDAGDIPLIQLNKYMQLGQLGEVEKDHVCDIVAVLKDAGELGAIVTKQTQREMAKRDITLVDQSAFSVRMTLWGKQAEDFNAPVESILAFQGVRVGDYQGRNLSMVSSSIMAVNPEIPEAFDLRGWYDTEGATVAIQSHSGAGSVGMNNQIAITEESLKSIGQVKLEELGKSEKGDYFNLRATVMFVKNEVFSYPACPTERCNKKMVQHGDDEWKCDKCDKTYPEPDHRYLIQLTVSDYSGVMYLSGFNEVGQILIGKTANELIQLQQEEDEKFKKVISEATCRTYDFVCRAKQETYQDNARTKYSIIRLGEVKWKEAGLGLAEMIMKNYGA
ncbi:hypothetical protein DFH28DRAFT_883097 [Melampsora americana]|nr:hypothetical protein DFH28DRAFT_883097 [Melampsora americana]